MFHVLIVVGSGRLMSVNDNTDKAVSLLREAAILLSGGRESEGNQDTASSTVGRSLTSPETVVTNSVSSSNHDQNRVLQNFRSLFAGYRSTNPGTSTCPKRSETKSLPPAKRNRPSGGGYYRVRETWTREFLCMANKDAQVVPNKADKLNLLAAGLGRKKLTFGNRDDAQTFKRKMEDAYPKLKLGGGFDLLRSGVRPGELLIIKPSPLGCTVPFLRDYAGLGQALIYVRPIQQNLDMSEVKQEVVSFALNYN